MNKYNVDLSKVYRKGLLLGIVMNIISVIIYGAIVYEIYSGRDGSKNVAENYLVMVCALAGVSVISSLVAIFLKKRLFFTPMVSSKEKFAEDFAQKAFQGSVILSAFAESIAIYGLILFFISLKPEIFIGFAAVSVLFYFYIRPTYSFLEESLKRQEQFADRGEFGDPSGKFNLKGWS